VPYVVAVCGAIIAFLFWAYTGQVERRVAAEIEVARSEEADIWRVDIETQARDFTAEKDKQNAAHASEIEGLTNEINRNRETMRQLALNDPLAAGDDIERFLARMQCLVALGERQNDSQARSDCYARADALDTSGSAYTVTFNADLAERFAGACKEWKSRGRPDELTEEEWFATFPWTTPEQACDWEVSGFNSDGWSDFETYYLRLEDHTRELNSDIDIRDLMIELLTGAVTDQSDNP